MISIDQLLWGLIVVLLAVTWWFFKERIRSTSAGLASNREYFDREIEKIRKDFKTEVDKVDGKYNTLNTSISNLRLEIQSSYSNVKETIIREMGELKLYNSNTFAHKEDLKDIQKKFSGDEGG